MDTQSNVIEQGEASADFIIRAGDSVYWEDVEIKVLTVRECPYLYCPIDIRADDDTDYYADYSDGCGHYNPGDWAYLYCPATGAVDWVPAQLILDNITDGLYQTCGVYIF